MWSVRVSKRGKSYIMVFALVDGLFLSQLGADNKIH